MVEIPRPMSIFIILFDYCLDCDGISLILLVFVVLCMVVRRTTS
jgi:hypothetical protein